LRLFRIEILVPPRAGDRATPVGVNLNQAGIDCKPFAAKTIMAGLLLKELKIRGSSKSEGDAGFR
jgi:hypothetical protein